MDSHTSQSKTNNKIYEYQYYICQSGEQRVSRPRCGIPKYRVDVVDAAVWGFVSDLIRHPKTLISKLEEAKKELDAHNHILRQRLEQIEATKKRQENKLALLLEQYATIKTDAVKQLFTRLQEETEHLFNDLNEEADQLQRELKANTISDSYIREWTQYTRQVRNKLDNADFKKRQEIIEGLNITGVLTVEEEAGRPVKVLYLSMYTYTERIPLERDLQFTSSSS
jgi:predicted nuclease with TOPRIM domain